MGRRELVCKICSHAKEFGGVRLPIANEQKKVVCNIWSHAPEFGWVRLSPFHGQERSGLHNLESCTGVWMGKTSPYLYFRREVICSIWSHALEFGCVIHPPC